MNFMWNHPSRYYVRPFFIFSSLLFRFICSVYCRSPCLLHVCLCGRRFIFVRLIDRKPARQTRKNGDPEFWKKCVFPIGNLCGLSAFLAYSAQRFIWLDNGGRSGEKNAWVAYTKLFHTSHSKVSLHYMLRSNGYGTRHGLYDCVLLWTFTLLHTLHAYLLTAFS